MSEVPHQVLADALRAEVGDGAVTAAVFTTFPLEVEFLLDEALRVLVPHSLSLNAVVRRDEIAAHLLREDVPVAVFHDARHLEPAPGSSRVPVSLVAVKHPTGFFHPKVAFLVVRPPRGRVRVVLAVGSANLTRAGWWSNVEAVHVSSVDAGSSILDRDDLVSFVEHLRAQTTDAGALRALDAVLEVLRSTRKRQLARLADDEPTRRFVWKGTAGRPGLTERLRRLLDQPGWEGYYSGGTLEVLSPWYAADGAGQVSQLLDLADVREALVVLPRAADSSGLLPEGTGTALPAPAAWAQLPADRARLAAEGAWRPLHAKVARWIHRRDRWETCVVGSFNLTRQAFQSGGNVEAAVVVDRPTPRLSPNWLEELHVLPPITSPDIETDDDGVGALGPSGATLIYDWTHETLQLAWSGRDEDVELVFHQGPVELFRLRSTSVGGQPDEHAVRLRSHLEHASSVLQVREDDRDGLYTVVTELNVADKPSPLVRTLVDVVNDLLVEDTGRAPERGGRFVEEVDGANGVPVEDGPLQAGHDVLQGYAALYEATTLLQERLCAALDEGDEREAKHRLVGQGSTGLGGLLTVARRELAERPRYVLVAAWTAEAVLEQTSSRVQAVEALHPDLETARRRVDGLRVAAEAALVQQHDNDDELRAFLAWGRREFSRSNA